MNLSPCERYSLIERIYIQMIRRLVEELEKAQLQVQDLRHDMREEKKKNKDFQTLLEEMVFLT
jgi:hypothetical protein